MTDSVAKMRAHAMHGLWQRKGFALTGREYMDLCADVAARTHERIAEGYGGRIFVPVKYRGARVLAVFDTASGKFILNAGLTTIESLNLMLGQGNDHLQILGTPTPGTHR